jgi:hypothetical protein
MNAGGAEQAPRRLPENRGWREGEGDYGGYQIRSQEFSLFRSLCAINHEIAHIKST